MIPPDLQQLLSPTIAQLANQVGSNLACSEYKESLTKSNQLISDTLRIVKSALVERIAAITVRAKLPAEIWCQIFCLLSLRDRFSVARVSATWRSISIANPALWTEIDYHASTHKITCRCQSCSTEERGPPCVGCGQRDPRDFDNIGLVRTALARSGNRSLRVDLQVTGDATFTAIVAVLRPFSNRIAHLHITADNSMEVVNFFDGLNSLRKLKRLVVVTRARHDGNDTQKTLFHPETVQPKALRHLEVEGPYLLYDESSLPYLEYVRLPMYSVSHFMQGLEECCDIRYLHYEISDAGLYDELTSELVADIQDCISRLDPEVIVVSNIYAPDTAAVLEVVHIPDLRDVRLAFSPDSPVIFDAFAIFEDIKTSWILSWTRSGSSRTTLELSATTASADVARKITWAVGRLDIDGVASLWDHLPPLEMLFRIEVDAINWNQPYLMIPDSSHLRELNLRFYNASEIFPAISILKARSSGWPKLELVRFQYLSHESQNSELRMPFPWQASSVLDTPVVPPHFSGMETLAISEPWSGTS